MGQAGSVAVSQLRALRQFAVPPPPYLTPLKPVQNPPPPPSNVSAILSAHAPSELVALWAVAALYASPVHAAALRWGRAYICLLAADVDARAQSWLRLACVQDCRWPVVCGEHGVVDQCGCDCEQNWVPDVNAQYRPFRACNVYMGDADDYTHALWLQETNPPPSARTLVYSHLA